METIFQNNYHKSRINFLLLLQQRLRANYVLNAGALEYMAQQGLPQIILERFESQVVTVKERDDWKKWLTDENITSEWHQRIVTEGALIRWAAGARDFGRFWINRIYRCTIT